MLVSFAVVVVGAIMFSSLKPVNNLSAASAETAPVQRVEAPSVGGAPQAAAETKTDEEKAAEEAKAAEEEKAQANASASTEAAVA